MPKKKKRMCIHFGLFNVSNPSRMFLNEFMLHLFLISWYIMSPTAATAGRQMRIHRTNEWLCKCAVIVHSVRRLVLAWMQRERAKGLLRGQQFFILYIHLFFFQRKQPSKCINPWYTFIGRRWIFLNFQSDCVISLYDFHIGVLIWEIQ